MGLFVFCLVFTHVADPDVTGRHLVAESAVAGEPGGLHAPGGHHHDHRQHAVEECALGQPPQGPDVDTPCLSPLDSNRRDGAPALTGASHRAGRDFVVPIAHAADCTILRI
ncbi:hypothetical protein AB0B50_26220 [Streptomyces sp. NPDC041068]|uniref:hypothetical protein n=1 Tax=Streptomyces sp. NPDC041068 TaxID=3155130 RepID=UPI0033F7A24B